MRLFRRKQHPPLDPSIAARFNDILVGMYVLMLRPCCGAIYGQGVILARHDTPGQTFYLVQPLRDGSDRPALHSLLVPVGEMRGWRFYPSISFLIGGIQEISRSQQTAEQQRPFLN